MNKFQDLAESVIGGNRIKVVELTQGYIDGGNSPLAIINEGLIAGMNVVGKRFKANEMYVPEVLMAARAMVTGVELVKPLLSDEHSKSAGKVLIGTVKGDLHDIGKNLVIMMLESRGYEVVDLGIDLPVEEFVKAVQEHKPQVLGMSALLTTTMQNMKATIDALTEAGVRDSIHILVGGAPITEEFAQQIGADGYAADAVTAAELVENLIA